MRLWHKDLIKCLPRKQLVSQWRELKCIAKNIQEEGTPHHILVNRIMDYNLNHFCNYANYVYIEMKNRGYKINENVLTYINSTEHYRYYMPFNDVFSEWHNDVYLRECLYNLEEKYICGGISEPEWEEINYKFKDKFDLISKKS